MNMRQLLLALATGVAIGVLLFLVQKTQAVNGDLHRERLANLRAINDLDVQLEKLLTRERVPTLEDSQQLAQKAPGLPLPDDDVSLRRVIEQLGDAQDALEKGPQGLKGLNAEIDKKLARFLSTLQDKAEIAFDFKARSALGTQQLVNSVNSVPVMADAAAALLPRDAQREQMVEWLNQLKAETSDFAITASPGNTGSIIALLDQLDQAAAKKDARLKSALATLRARCNDVIAGKRDLVKQLNDFLRQDTGRQLQDLEQAYVNWHEERVNEAARYRIGLVAYSVVLLGVLALVGVRLATSFRQLDRAYAKIAHANANLETQVRERTADLTMAMADLQNSQAQLVQSEKMASLGQLVAGVAHEINTPLGYARSNNDIVRDSLAGMRDLCLAQHKALMMLTAEGVSDEDVAAAMEEAQVRGQSINAEELVQDLNNLLDDSEHGLTSIADLVMTLKDFSRVDRSRSDRVNLNDCSEGALKISHNALKHHVEVVRDYGELPLVECAPSQINQVFLNLYTNAAQAMSQPGKLFITTRAEGGNAVIRVRDTGSGMTDEVKKKIFEPFFTTKPVGVGTGLGLSIVFRIIEDHHGKVEVNSTVGVGTEFVITLPLKQPRKTDKIATQEEVTTALAAA
ncbi:MAG TPA: ATP-binding protein [Nevskiaceae bacterium]|nr:ATP-binding protein [Nevskiaceae bacterium]